VDFTTLEMLVAANQTTALVLECVCGFSSSDSACPVGCSLFFNSCAALTGAHHFFARIGEDSRHGMAGAAASVAGSIFASRHVSPRLIFRRPDRFSRPSWSINASAIREINGNLDYA
jgi:hypothetical protein